MPEGSSGHDRLNGHAFGAAVLVLGILLATRSNWIARWVRVELFVI